MKILFLDFDGVLNSRECVLKAERAGPEARVFGTGAPSGVLGIYPEYVTRLNRICLETGAKIVVSSTWRLGRTIEQLRDILAKAGLDPAVEVIDTTPIYGDGIVIAQERGHEIQAWLDANAEKLGVDRFAILDDDDDMLHLKHRLVKTSFEHGLQPIHVNYATQLLRRKSELQV